MLKLKLFFSITVSLTLALSMFSCKDEESSNPEAQTYYGNFIDSPVEGLGYSSGDITGLTNKDGQFEYYENENISFFVGGISLGEIPGKLSITPIDLVENADINNQIVRNISSFLQSIDEDNDPGNGILISEPVRNSLQSKNLDFDSDNFYFALTNLINELNNTNSSTLQVVNSNDAALYLAESLDMENEYKFLPRVYQGRNWEQGEYFNYNTANTSGEYVLQIGEDLNGVRYNFGNNSGYYMNMEYEQNKLTGLGNYYYDINAEPPVDSSPFYEYKNRITSPGFVFDYMDNTYIGYYNYYKKNGEIGSLQGTYESYLYYEQKRPDQEPETKFVLQSEITINDSNEEGNFPTSINYYDVDGNITSTENKLIMKDHINADMVILVRFQENDYIFSNFDINELDPVTYVFPGLVAIKN